MSNELTKKTLMPVVFHREYWHYSFKPKKKTLLICVLSLLMSISVASSAFFIPVGENLRIYFSFLPSFFAGMIGGPIFALGYGFASDIVGFLLFPSGAYFFGYTVSSMAGALIYGLFFYRQKVTYLKIAICKFLINLFVNVLLGSLWSAMLFSNGYIYYLTKSVVKNISMLPIEIFLLCVVYKALEPTLQKMDLIGNYNSNNTVELDIEQSTTEQSDVFDKSDESDESDESNETDDSLTSDTI